MGISQATQEEECLKMQYAWHACQHSSNLSSGLLCAAKAHFLCRSPIRTSQSGLVFSHIINVMQGLGSG